MLGDFFRPESQSAFLLPINCFVAGRGPSTPGAAPAPTAPAASPPPHSHVFSAALTSGLPRGPCCLEPAQERATPHLHIPDTRESPPRPPFPAPPPPTTPALGIAPRAGRRSRQRARAAAAPAASAAAASLYNVRSCRRGSGRLFILSGAPAWPESHHRREPYAIHFFIVPHAGPTTCPTHTKPRMYVQLQVERTPGESCARHVLILSPLSDCLFAIS